MLVLLRLHLAPPRKTKRRRALEPILAITSVVNVIFYEKRKLEKLHQRLNTAVGHKTRETKERFEKSKMRVKYFEALPKAAFFVSIE